MTSWTSQDGLATLHVGHVVSVLRSLPAKSAHCVITSPPYWGLRDYGLEPSTWADGSACCYGLEPTIELYVAHTVEIMREIHRVLRDDGLVWWNIGDSFFGSWGNYGGQNRGKGSQRVIDGGSLIDNPAYDGTEAMRPPTSLPQGNLKPGDQCLIPHRVVLALQADGWFVRSTVVWSKRSPMPESVGGWSWRRCRVKVAGCAKGGGNGTQAMLNATERHNAGMSEKWLATWQPCPGCSKCEANGGYVLRKGRWRCTNSWEPIFQLAKSPEYFADAQAVAEPAACAAMDRESKVRGQFDGKGGREPFRAMTETRNPRNVWSLSAEPLKAKHFAAFPSTIPRRCIAASTSAAGCCPTCGSQWAPIVRTERVATRPGLNPKEWKHGDADDLAQRSDLSPNRDPQRHIQRTVVDGYRATCQCGPHEPVPCTVLEPFAGSGTTLMVARWMGRKSIGIELSEKYATEIAFDRIESLEPNRKPKSKRVKRCKAERLLF